MTMLKGKGYRVEANQCGSASSINDELTAVSNSSCTSVRQSSLPRSPLLFKVANEIDSPSRKIYPRYGPRSASIAKNVTRPYQSNAMKRRRRRSILSPAVLMSALVTLGTFPMSGAQTTTAPNVTPVSPKPTVEDPNISGTNTLIPTRFPIDVGSPTATPSANEQPTNTPGLPPTLQISSNTPTPRPTTTKRPTNIPTFSPIPSPEPSSLPTRTPTPSQVPSPTPSSLPSDLPSDSPTVEPTFAVPIRSTATFRQEFTVGNGRTFDEIDEELLQELYANYTERFAPVTDLADIEKGRVNSTCEVIVQVGLTRRRRMSWIQRWLRGGEEETYERIEDFGYRLRSLQTSDGPMVLFTVVDYTMSYVSVHTNVTEYPLLFVDYVNDNLDTVTLELDMLGLNVTETNRASRIFVKPEPSPSPTGTASPSEYPTASPSTTMKPSMRPSHLPTVSLRPSHSPTLSPSGETTEAPTKSGGGGGLSLNTVVAVSVVIVGSIILIGFFIYYRRRKAQMEQGALQDRLKSGRPPPQDWKTTVRQPDNSGHASHPTVEGLYTAHHGPGVLDGEHVVSPSESLVSNQSLLSAGNCMHEDSGDEADAAQNLADEFDQYKDQNLEKMRADIEGNLTGFDGMMSQALTKALIDDDETHIDPSEYSWNGSTNGFEIEASVLGEVIDWLKRKEFATIEERRTFMQETLNKMVASVRHGVLGPDDASRSIHECAALLDLQLATEIPVTTLIITGMRKTVLANDMMKAFKEFGDIAEAAVSPDSRGFGILRFKKNKSADLAMQKFRASEIVVQDVAVQLKVLKPGRSYGSEGLKKSSSGVKS